LFPGRVTVALAPDHIVVGERTIVCDSSLGAEPWHGPLAALGGVQWKDRVRVTAVLSNHFVRYALVPWNTALADPAEEEAYVRHHFTKIHGERAKSWALRWSAESAESADAPRLATAVDAGLITALRDSVKGKARLVSIQPYLMAAANRVQGAMPASGAWFVFAERERACVALHAGGRWRSVQNAKGPWLDTLEREWHRAEAGDGHAAPRLALLAGARPVADAAGWTFKELPA
jgi:hypothetical protein